MFRHFEPLGLMPVMSFTNKCEEVEGTFEVRFFDPDDDPVSDPGEFVFSDTFTGRRVTVN